MNNLLGRLLGSARERGAVMFIVAGTTIVVLLMGAMAVDLSVVATQGQTLQNAADSAALAGAQAYRTSIGEALVATSVDEAAATAIVTDLLAQNGVDVGGSITVDVEFPDSVNNTEVKVTLTNSDPELFLAGVTGVVGTIERTATARFERCSDDCIKEVQIPAPFVAVDTTGDGDGYKPIPVGNNLYALNHNNNVQKQIVCVSRITQEHCWSSGPGKLAYPSGYIPPATPEMPHAAVIDTKIYWSVSISAGHYLYCWETETDTPCSTPLRLNDRPRASSLPSRIENRGGGTVAVDGKVYVFTDDHRVHCVNPGFTMTACTGYESGGLATGLGAALFPTNEASDGNHGSSIDRVVNEDNGFIYSTLHIDNAVPTGVVDCSTPLADPIGHEVVIQNASSLKFLSTRNSDSWVFMSSDGNDAYDRWEVIDAGNGRVVLQSLRDGRYLDGGDSDGAYVNTQPSWNGVDKEWVLDDFDGTSFRIQNEWGTHLRDVGTWIREYFSTSGNVRWEFYPYQCGVDPFYTGTPDPLLPYASGTWLHCWDSVNSVPCAGFVPSKIHVDSDSFSGRLFFYYDAGHDPDVLGVCSTGFVSQIQNYGQDRRGDTELSCVDPVDGSDEALLESSMPEFVSALDATNYPNWEGSNYSWGTWGDPHYSPEENRLFFPTHRLRSRVLCWDFDDGWCLSRQGISAEHGAIQDYGFFSEGNCIYGLGHNAVFWAFHAEDINLDCTGSGQTTTITPCNCSGELYWGTLYFDVDLHLFDTFLVEIYNSAGTRVVPEGPDDPDDPDYVEGHSLHDPDGEIIDLNHLPIINASDELTVKVRVEAENDPWAQGDQSFTIELVRVPRLID